MSPEAPADDFLLGNYVVCVIDLLGQRERLKGWCRMPLGDIPDERFLHSVKQSLGTVEWFRNAFADFFAAYTAKPPPEFEKLKSMDLSLSKRVQNLAESKVQTQQFSDTFLFYSMLRNAHGDLTVGPIFKMIQACCMANLFGLVGKVPLRGAIAIGTGCELSSGVLYGPALAVAHQLESEVAEYPRIVLHEDLVRFLQDNQVFSNDESISQIGVTLARECLSFLHVDSDSNVMVDFAGPAFRALYDGVATEMDNALKLAFSFALRSHERFVLDGNQKLIERYAKLLAYFNAKGITPV